VTESYTWADFSGTLSTGASLDLATTSSIPGDVISCTVDVADSDGGSTSDTASITVYNRSPLTPTVTITWSGSGSGPDEADDLFCVGVSSDPDGDVITYSYSWTSDSGATVTGDTVLSSETTASESWSCTVEASDGYNTNSSTSVVSITANFLCGDIFVDARDGQSYDTVEISSSCWMRENLNVGAFVPVTSSQDPTGVLTKWCYDDIESNCDIWGGQYSYYNAIRDNDYQITQGICPSGWRIPTETEWESMQTAQGSSMFTVSETTASLLFSGRHNSNQWLYGTLCQTSEYVQVHHWYSDTNGGGFAWAWNFCPSPGNWAVSEGQFDQGRAIRCVEM
jgi:uncharacterized protein (TIGR02145 family)